MKLPREFRDNVWPIVEHVGVDGLADWLTDPVFPDGDDGHALEFAYGYLLAVAQMNGATTWEVVEACHSEPCEYGHHDCSHTFAGPCSDERNAREGR